MSWSAVFLCVTFQTSTTPASAWASSGVTDSSTHGGLIQFNGL